jgi:Kdo2-lipid IVA lauroyltransferase/acyltransferase
MMSRIGIAFMRLIAHLPLSWVRALGRVLGLLLYTLVASRRKVVEVNLRLCFPQWTPAERRRAQREVFVNVAQSFLDRAWLWHAPPEVVKRRVHLTGAVEELGGQGATILFCPHFVGLDAGVSAMSQQVPRTFVGIYTQQSNPVIDAWVLKGRNRFGDARPMSRSEGVRDLLAALRRGHVMYLLPDMNFGPEDSIFVPFYGVPAATVPSLSRFAPGQGQGGAADHEAHARGLRGARLRSLEGLPEQGPRGRHGADEPAAAAVHRRDAVPVLLGAQALQDPAAR